MVGRVICVDCQWHGSQKTSLLTSQSRLLPTYSAELYLILIEGPQTSQLKYIQNIHLYFVSIICEYHCLVVGNYIVLMVCQCQSASINISRQALNFNFTGS